MVRTTALYTLISVASEIPLGFHSLLLRQHLILRCHDNRLKKGAAEVGELFYNVKSLSLDGDVELDVSFFQVLADVSLVSFATRNSLTISVFTLVFA